MPGPSLNNASMSKRELRAEVGLAIIFITVQAYLLRDSLWGDSTLIHDNIIWNFPAFTYYFQELSAGYLPVYNFFSRLGEPFVPVAAQMRFWDPLQTLIGLASWKTFANPIQ